MNAIHDQHDLVNWTGQLRIRIRRDLDRRIVGSDQHGILASHPFGGSYSDARSTCSETGIVFFPKLAPAGVDDHRIAGLKRQLLGGQRLLEIRSRDPVLLWEPLYTSTPRSRDPPGP